MKRNAAFDHIRILLTILVIFRVSAFLARSAYATFIIHPPVLVATGLLLAGWGANPLIKFLAVGGLAYAGCAVLSRLLLAVPFLRRVL
jgi:hypothetical protein